MSGGIRSGLAPWIGGASSPPFSPPPPPTQAMGVRSMLAFWMGGAMMPRFTRPAVVVTHHGADDRLEDFADQRRLHLARLRADDEVVLRVIITSVTKGLLH